MKARQRWLYVCLPQLALDLWVRAGADREAALAVIDGNSARRVIHQSSALARSSGITAGMAVATAQAMRADLQLAVRNPQAEQQALAHLAGWAYGYSSRVAIREPPVGRFPDRAKPVHLPNPSPTRESVNDGHRPSTQASRPYKPMSDPEHRGGSEVKRRSKAKVDSLQTLIQDTACTSTQPPGLLLEMAGSHRLFGPDVLQRMSSELDALGYQCVHGHGPTPAAARLAARVAHTQQRRSAAYERIQSQAPLALTELEAEDVALLQRCGLHTLGELLALPRDGLIRRIGRRGLQRIDQLSGLQAEPIVEYRPPLNFSNRIELAAPLQHSQALLFPLRRLLLELCAQLQGSNRAVQHLELMLQHESGIEPPSHSFEVGLLSPSQNAEHLLDLCRYALEKQQLAGPVIALELKVPQPLIHQPPVHDLFQAASTAPDWNVLMERLRGRLGAPAIQQFKLEAGHRPERSFSHCSGAQDPKMPEMPIQQLAAYRPLWLLPEPLPIRIEDYQLCGAPERIESGWWDGADAARDYYRALDAQARRLWLYQDRRNPHRWFLHGIFG